MIPNHALDDAEAQACPILPRGKKRLEQFRRSPRDKARSSIDNAKFDEPVFRLENLDANFASSRAVLNRVIQQVDKDLLKSGVVRHDRRAVALSHAYKFDCLAFSPAVSFHNPTAASQIATRESFRKRVGLIGLPMSSRSRTRLARRFTWARICST